MAPSPSHFLQQIRQSALNGWGAVHMPRWMQTSTFRWLRGCLSSFNNTSLFQYSCIKIFLICWPPCSAYPVVIFFYLGRSSLHNLSIVPLFRPPDVMTRFLQVPHLTSSEACRGHQNNVSWMYSKYSVLSDQKDQRF